MSTKTGTPAALPGPGQNRQKNAIAFPNDRGYASRCCVEALTSERPVVERQNLTMRMQLRRLTRLTNAFSKKLSHLKAAVALHFAWYNFVRVHKSLRVTPAMESGIANHAWNMQELLGISTKNA